MLNDNCTLGRNDEFPLENFKRGTRVWIKDPDKVWTTAELVDDLTFACSVIRVQKSEEIIEYDVVKNGLPFLCNPDILLGKDDLTSLSYLHEPAVLNNLRHRFEVREAIYTYCGIVLVAINPYADCSSLYGDDVIAVYRGVGKQVRDYDPHIYAIAEEAYFDMCEYGKDQSVIISGESGAGKTMSAKFVMRYLASVASNSMLDNDRFKLASDVPANFKIENRVLASNPIMEAIGNAKTIRNDNSSRFGKFIQINFSERLKICGAEMKTYLLEKSRVVFQSENERNYHIFYQMCAAAQQGHPALLGLNLLEANRYAYASGGCCMLSVDGVDDAQNFGETVDAFEMLKIPVENQREIFRVIAGILLLGNIRFTDVDRTSIRVEDENVVRQLCKNLYNIDEKALMTWLTAREIRAGGDVVRKSLSMEEAIANRDALAKVIYACLFNWIVERINENLMQQQHEVDQLSAKIRARAKAGSASGGDGGQASPLDSNIDRFIGVLDIYGFETFEHNSFEQFCINYANEKLQQQFNQHVFKLEQAEYEREEISWVRIDFYDNQLCIDLIECRPGIIDYLDEQCKTGRGTDADWLERMRECKQLQRSEHLLLPRIRDASFTVKHFASNVAYRVDGFIEKNKDTVSEQLLDTIGKTKFAFLRQVVSDMLSSSSTGVRRKKTVAVQFRDSLSKLIGVLSSTRPHYVRCIKPNDVKTAFFFDPKRSIQQLRANGVLETVRISAAGFPSRWSYKDFSVRYRVLYPEGKTMWRDNPKEFAKRACKKVLNAEKFALGKTKILFRTGQVALIERIRTETFAKSATTIQTAWRGFVCRRHFQKIRRAVLHIQAFTKAFLVYRRAKYLQMYRAAVCIQAAFRGYLCRRRYLRVQQTVLLLQSFYRGQVGRRKLMKMRYERSAITIQRFCRGWLVRRERVNYLRKVMKVQCCVRRWLAKKQLKALRIEARSVSHLQNLNTGLEKKIINLQQKVDSLTSDRTRLLEGCAEGELAQLQLKELKRRFVTLQSVNQTDVPKLKVMLAELSAEHMQLSEELNTSMSTMKIAAETAKKSALDMSAMLAQNAEKITTLESELAKRSGEVDKLKEQCSFESKSRHNLEMELEQMREQLLENAALLASSSDFSRVGSLRGDRRSILTGAGSVEQQFEQSLGHNGMTLLLEQQRMINDLRLRVDEKERTVARLQFIICANFANQNSDRVSSAGAYEAQKIQDLSLMVSKYKTDLQKLYEQSNVRQEFMLAFEKVQEENERLRDESTEIRALMASFIERQINGSISVNGSGLNHLPQPSEDSGCWSTSAANSDDGLSSSVAHLEMDERIEQERHLRHYKQLLDIASRELSERDERILQLEQRINIALANDDVDATLTFASVSSLPIHSNGTIETANNGVSQIEHLVQENLSLQQKCNRKSDELAEARAYLRGYSTLIDTTISPESNGVDDVSTSEVLHLDPLRGDSVTHTAMLEVFNIPEFTRLLIYDLKPRLAKRLRPCLPAYVLLMAFRFYDQTSDDAGLTSLFNAVHAILRENSMTSADTDVLALWLANSWRLLNLLRQYSSEKGAPTEWSARNTAAQSRLCLRNFNLEPIRNQLKLRVEVFYCNLMKRTVEPLLTPKIVPAILQHESYDVRAAFGNDHMSGNGSNATGKSSLSDLLEFLNFIHLKLRCYGADELLVTQVFRQVSHWIVALALNHMMFRKELCTPEKAISIKHNIMEVQSWLAENKIGVPRHNSDVASTGTDQIRSISDVFEPLIQASHLLQLRKSEAQLDVLCGEMTSRLRPKQVLAILRHFTPSADGAACGVDDAAVDESFLAKVSARLMERSVAAATRKKNAEESGGQATTTGELTLEKDELLMRGTYLDPFDTTPFLYSELPLETLSIPASLGLQTVSRLI